MALRGVCACTAFTYTTVLAAFFITRYSAASAEYQIYDATTPEVIPNYRCLILKTEVDGSTTVLANHADG